MKTVNGDNIILNYTGNMWGDPSNYTASINTSRITLEKGADLIINYIETLQK